MNLLPFLHSTAAVPVEAALTVLALNVCDCILYIYLYMFFKTDDIGLQVIN